MCCIQLCTGAAESTVSDRDRVMGDMCYVCEDFTNKKWIGCFFLWYHVKCVHLMGIKHDNIHKINQICTSCLYEASLTTNIVELGLVADMLHTDQMDLSWTEVKRQETLENLLVAKASSLEKKLRLIETKEFTENINDQWKKKKKVLK